MQERGHQVGQMRLVYRAAQRVIIWLGASNNEIDCLFDWMAVLDQQMLEIAHPHTISTWENQWSLVVWHLRRRSPPRRDQGSVNRVITTRLVLQNMGAPGSSTCKVCHDNVWAERSKLPCLCCYAFASQYMLWRR